MNLKENLDLALSGEEVDIKPVISVTQIGLTEAMEKASEEEILYYTEKYPKNKTSKYMTDTHMETAWDDDKLGRSPSARKAYLEAQQNHKDKAIQLKELDNYISDLSSDIVEMIENASNDERSYLERKISALATKIG